MEYPAHGETQPTVTASAWDAAQVKAGLDDRGLRRVSEGIVQTSGVSV